METPWYGLSMIALGFVVIAFAVATPSHRTSDRLGQGVSVAAGVTIILVGALNLRL